MENQNKAVQSFLAIRSQLELKHKQLLVQRKQKEKGGGKVEERH